MQKGFFNTKFLAVVLIITVAFGSIVTGINYISFNNTFPRYPTGTTEGYIYTTASSQLYNATESDLRNAIWSLNSTDGGQVFLPEATITLTAPINISRSNISLIGCGRSTILYTAGDINLLELYGTQVYPNDLRGVYIEKIMFRGSAGHTSQAGITLGRAHHIMIQECWFDNLYDGMNIGNTDDTDNCWFSNCQFLQIGHYAMYFSGRTQENSIIGNTMESVTLGGIYMVGQQNVIMGNTVEEVGLGSGNGYGIYVGGKENVCTGNTVRETGSHGIYVTYNTGVLGGNQTVTSNLIADCEGDGIYTRGQWHVISDNNIVRNGDYGVYVAAHGKGVLVSNNHIGVHTIGYYIDVTGDAVFSGNTLGPDGYEHLVNPSNVSINMTGALWLNNVGSQIFQFSSSGVWSYLYGGEAANSNLGIQPGTGAAYIHLYGGGDIRFAKDDSHTDFFRFYEGAKEMLAMALDVGETDCELSSPGGYNITINDVFKIEPRAAAPTSPVEGMIYANSGDNNLYYYDGIAWRDMT